MTLPAGLRHCFPDSTKFFAKQKIWSIGDWNNRELQCGPLFYFPILLRVSIDPLFHCRIVCNAKNFTLDKSLELNFDRIGFRLPPPAIKVKLPVVNIIERLRLRLGYDDD
jgi:hypothetical protein